MCLSHVPKYILMEKTAFLTWERILKLYTCTLCGRFVESGKGLKAGKDCSDNLERCLECQRSKNPRFSFKQPLETQLTLLWLLSYHHQIKCSPAGACLQLSARHTNIISAMSCLLSSWRSFPDLISVINCDVVFTAALCICWSEWESPALDNDPSVKSRETELQSSGMIKEWERLYTPCWTSAVTSEAACLDWTLEGVQ